MHYDEWIIFLVYGPPCSGKTLNSEALRKVLDCEFAIDAMNFSRDRVDRAKGARVLVLATEENPNAPLGYRRPYFYEHAVRVPIETAKKMLGDRWIEPVRNFRKSPDFCHGSEVRPVDDLELVWEPTSDEVTTLRGYLRGHPETTLFLISPSSPDGQSVLLRGFVIPDAEEREPCDFEQAKSKAAQYMRDWRTLLT